MRGTLVPGLLLLLLSCCSWPLSEAASKCAPGCTTYGVCNEELGRCDCPRHRTGDDCSIELPLAQACKRSGFDVRACTLETPGRCLNNCTERGRCISGWCHCSPGYYGGDCSLSLGPDGSPQLFAGLGYTPAKRGPSIYIYEVPPQFNTWKNIEKFDRPLYSQLWKRIISSGHRTLDGANADYYYIPVDFRYLFQDASTVLQYVWETWPYWNATGGERHLLLSTSDLGGCEGAQLMRIRSLTHKATWLTAWGLTRKHPRVWWPGCHRPGLDIVIPIPAQTNLMLRTPLNPLVQPKPERNITFYFAGKICGDNRDPLTNGSWPVCQTRINPLYSAGVRQLVYHHHWRRPGYKVVPRSPTYIADMSSALFCLAPTGGGHGKRQVLVARFGCIPVPINDYVLQPFEPELDWKEFSVPVAEADIPRMHEILGNITREQLARMQSALACASRHLWWSSMWGGIFGETGAYDAFATLMEILGARRRHPGVSPQDLMKVDEHFRKFVTCQLGDDTVERPGAWRTAAAESGAESGASGATAEASGARRRQELCTYSYDDGLEGIAPTQYCISKSLGKYGYPGGAVCQGAPNVAQCPRPWQ